jgi:hypothetical protein
VRKDEGTKEESRRQENRMRKRKWNEKGKDIPTNSRKKERREGNC